MVERIYPINVSYHFTRTVYVRYDNKSQYKNLSADDKENIRNRIIEFVKIDLSETKFKGMEDNLQLEILDDIEIK